MLDAIEFSDEKAAKKANFLLANMSTRLHLLTLF
jgi:hypothetical protein